MAWSWSWMEQGPTTTTSRSSWPCSTREMARRSVSTSASAGFGGGSHFLQQRGCDQRAHGLDARVVDAGGVVGG